MTLSLYISSLFIFIFLSFLISGTETAYFSLSKKDLPEFKKYRNFLKQIFITPESFLVVILLLNTLFHSFASATFTEVSLFLFPNANEIFLEISDILLFTLIILIFGEIIPKMIAYANPVSFSKTITPFFRLLYFPLKNIFFPFYLLIGKIAKKFPKREKPISFEGEILSILSIATREKYITIKEEEMLLRLFKLNHTPALQFATHREKIVAYKKEEPLKNLIENYKKGKRYSHYPVFDNTLNNIKGVVKIWNIFKENIDENTPLEYLVSPVSVYPSAMPISKLFSNMFRQGEEFVLLKDKDEIQGCISIKDIFRALF